MSWFTVIFIAFGLAMDSFAVSITGGITIKRLRISNALKVAVFFGLFQAFMPIIGWFGGNLLINFIVDIDHWIAFGLLSIIGIRMIYESLKSEENKKKIDLLNNYILFVLAIATSIDAFIIGVTFACLRVSIITPIIIIGTITFLVSFVGVFIGNGVGHFFEKRIEVAGGIILIMIGIKILFEHFIKVV